MNRHIFLTLFYLILFRMIFEIYALFRIITKNIRVLFLNRKQNFKESEELNGSTETIYKAAEGNVRNQQRDIAKKYVVDGAVHYVFGIENQSDTRKVKHVEAVLEMIRVFTKDGRYEKIKPDIMEMVRKGEDVSVCKFADRMVKLGEEQGIIGLVCKKLRKNKSLEVIADEIEEELWLVEKICEVAEAFAPEYECEKVCEAWRLSKNKTA